MYRVNKKYRGNEGNEWVNPYLVFITWIDEDDNSRAAATHVAATDSYDALLMVQEFHDTCEAEVDFHYVQQLEYFRTAEDEERVEVEGPCILGVDEE